VVIEPGEQEVQERELLDEDRFLELAQQGEDRGRHDVQGGHRVPAIRSLLERINVDKLADELRDPCRMRRAASQEADAERLKIVDAMRNSGNAAARNDPRWMILALCRVPPICGRSCRSTAGASPRRLERSVPAW